jgi:hypothetical protein
VADIALFTDLDGTLIPPELVRSRPEVPPPLDAALRRLAELVPVAVVTTKDCGFAARAVPYAAAYACINGIEVRAGRYVAVARGLNTAAVEEVYKAASGLEAYVEAKRTWHGELAGVTVDWRGKDTPPRGLEEVLQLAQRLGLKILRYSRHPFADVYGADVDKRRGRPPPQGPTRRQTRGLHGRQRKRPPCVEGGRRQITNTPQPKPRPPRPRDDTGEIRRPPQLPGGSGPQHNFSVSIFRIADPWVSPM